MFRQESVSEDDKRLPLQSAANYLSRPQMSRNLFWRRRATGRLEPHLPTDDCSDCFRLERLPGGEAAKLPFPIHPHMLRHSTGYKLANDGHDTRALQHYLGHKNIQHTVRYTEMSPDRFKNFWKD